MKELEILNLLNLLADKESCTLKGYLNHIVVDSRPPQRLKDVIEPWQEALYNILIPLFESAAGLQDTERKAAFITAGKGSSKTSSIAQLVNWALCYSKINIKITCAAADKDQAGILLERMEAEGNHNPWIKNKITFNRTGAIGPTGKMQIISSDAPTSSGALDDIIICDELTFWKKDDLYQMLIAGRNKRKDGIFIIISNAGIQHSWQHNLWLHAQSSNSWIAHEVPANSASWVNQKEIEDDEKVMLPSMFKRLHRNQWVNPSEEIGYLTRAMVEECIDENLQEQEKGDDNFRYILAVDCGLTNDRTALAVLHGDGDYVYLDKLNVMQGSPTERVQIKAIEEWIDTQLQNFNVIHLVLDPYQLEQIAQKYQRRMEVERFAFGGSNHFKLAQNLRTLIINKRLKLYQGAGLLIVNNKPEDLVDEIELLITEEKGGKYRVNHLPGKHDDRYVVLAMGAFKAVELELIVNPLQVLQYFNEEKKDEEDMDVYFKQIKWLDSLGSFQICPIIKGQEYRLLDYSTQVEAAWAVNEALKLAGEKEVNKIDKSKLPSETRQQFIVEKIRKELESRRLLAVSKVKV